MIKNPFKYLRAKLMKPRPFLADGKYQIVPAFEWDGEVYYMHKDPLNILAGRGMNALVFIEEMMMRCDVDYLRKHTEAMDAVFSDTKKISLQEIFRLNANLKERTDLLAALPKHVFKLASVVFFTKDECYYRYDLQEGMEKVRKWEATPGMYDFFLQTPLVTLIPSLALPDENSQNYLKVVEKIDEMHFEHIRRLLSERTSANATKN